MYIIPNIPEYSDSFWQGLLDDLAQLSHVNTFTSLPPTCMLFAVERFFWTFRFERYNVLIGFLLSCTDTTYQMYTMYCQYLEFTTTEESKSSFRWIFHERLVTFWCCYSYSQYYSFDWSFTLCSLWVTLFTTPLRAQVQDFKLGLDSIVSFYPLYQKVKTKRRGNLPAKHWLPN